MLPTELWGSAVSLSNFSVAISSLTRLDIYKYHRHSVSLTFSFEIDKLFSYIMITRRYCSGHFVQQRKFVESYLGLNRFPNHRTEHYADTGTTIMLGLSWYPISLSIVRENSKTGIMSACFHCLRKWPLQYILLTHYQSTNFRLFQTQRVYRQQFQI